VNFTWSDSSRTESDGFLFDIPGSSQTDRLTKVAPRELPPGSRLQILFEVDGRFFLVELNAD
jgi:hypothetical protein